MRTQLEYVKHFKELEVYRRQSESLASHDYSLREELPPCLVNDATAPLMISLNTEHRLPITRL